MLGAGEVVVEAAAGGAGFGGGGSLLLGGSAEVATVVAGAAEAAAAAAEAAGEAYPVEGDGGSEGGSSGTRHLHLAFRRQEVLQYLYYSVLFSVRVFLKILLF